MACLLVDVPLPRDPDRVFGPDCPTQRVYEEGAKDVALSVLTGLNCKCIATSLSDLVISLLTAHYMMSESIFCVTEIA
jgi:hypothetical protein